MVGRFNLVGDRMRERTFGKVSRIAVFADPIRKAGPKTVRRCDPSGCVALGFRAKPRE